MKLGLSTGFAFLLLSSTANAATMLNTIPIPGNPLFNFQVTPSDFPFPGDGVLSVDGTVIASATASNSNATPYKPVPYLDGGLVSNPAGLGVCSTGLNGTECNNSGDDNITMGESVTLNFDTDILIDDIYFRNANHGTSFDANALVDISTDGIIFQSLTLTHIVSNLAAIVTDTITFRYNNQQFYVSGLGAPVPLPAALPMMLIGLLGLLGFRKATT